MKDCKGNLFHSVEASDERLLKAVELENMLDEIEKSQRKCLIIDVACSFGTRVIEKEKMDNYQDQERQIQKIRNCKRVAFIPIVVAALGTVTGNLTTCVSEIGLDESNLLQQKVYLQNKARILRRNVET